MSIHGLETRPGIVMDGAAAEHIREAVPVIASYGDAMGIRAFAERRNLQHDLADREFASCAQLVDKPLINMESAISTRARAWPTGRRWTSSACRATAASSCCRGPITRRRCRWPCPRPRCTWRHARHGRDRAAPGRLRAAGRDHGQGAAAARSQSGGSVRETHDRREAMEGAHVIYAKEWSSTRHYGDRMADAEAAREPAGLVRDEPWFDNARDDCRFMHCLPVRRGRGGRPTAFSTARAASSSRRRATACWGQMAVLHQMIGTGT
jgi:N-acetylornithine carbamoyltransferase